MNATSFGRTSVGNEKKERKRKEREREITMNRNLYDGDITTWSPQGRIYQVILNFSFSVSFFGVKIDLNFFFSLFYLLFLNQTLCRLSMQWKL